jgi:hypothetical protein
MAICIQNGLTCPIANPEKITSTVLATDLIMGRDDFAVRFIMHFQDQTR